jgi:predicted O-methyltransferase YrrM
MENFKDKFTPTNNDLSYYPLLYKALEETKGDVLELGMGYGSTELLNNYCKKNKRFLFSFEEKQSWFEKFSHLAKEGKNFKHELNFVVNWDIVKNNHEKADVIFIDHAPGERRKEDIVHFKDTKGIIVCHDTEPAADYGYQMRQYFKLFKYKAEVKTNGAWATALSNEYDITKWYNESFGSYIITE